MTSPITKQALTNASLDAATMEKVLNDAPDTINPTPGAAAGTVTARLGRTYYNMARAIELVAESGGTIGKMTLAELNADLAHDANSIAFVAADSDADNNGWYIKSGGSGSGSWAKSDYNRTVTKEQISELEQFNVKPLILFSGGWITVNKDKSVTYPSGLVTLNNAPVSYWKFQETTIIPTANSWRCDYFDLNELIQNTGTSPFKFKHGGNPTPPVDPYIIVLGSLYENEYQSDFPFMYEKGSRISYRLNNMITAGNLAEAGRYTNIYGRRKGAIDPSFYASLSDIAPIVESQENVMGYGCNYSFEHLGGSASTGGYIDLSISDLDSLTTQFCVYGSMLVHLRDGSWGGLTMGPIMTVTKRPKAGGNESALLTLGAIAGWKYIQLLSGLRLYYLSAALPNLDQAHEYSTVRIGFRIPSGFPSGNWVRSTGFFITVTEGSQRFLGDVIPSDMNWRVWEQVDGVGVSINRRSLVLVEEGLLALQQQVDGDRTSGLRLLADCLGNPLHSIMIRLIGDSITWGSGASGTGPSEPRSHALTDPRANLTCLSWANRLRDYLGQTYSQRSSLVSGNPGVGYYEKTHTVDPTVPLKGMRFIHPATGMEIPFSDLAIRTYATTPPGPYFKRCIDFYRATAAGAVNYNAWPEFDLYGDNFTILFAGQSLLFPNQDDCKVGVYVDGVKIGEFPYNTVNAWSQKSPEFTVPMGKHVVQLRNESALITGIGTGIFRFEAIRVRRKIQVANDGISGTNTWSWQPQYTLLANAVQDGDEFVFCQLGTNDRYLQPTPPDPVRTREWLRIVGQYCQDTRGKQFILMSSNTTAADYDSGATNHLYTQGEVDRVIHDLGQNQGWDVISNYKASMPAWLWNRDALFSSSDQLHPNDSGHGIIAQNIIKEIEERLRK